jgi:Mrp family chromosome partitioning ATPase
MLQSSDTAVIWRGPMKIGVIKQFLADVAWGELDFLIIDSPPGTGDEPLTVAQEMPGSKSIIVTTSQAVSILDARKSITFCKQLSMPISGLIENMSGLICPHCGERIELFGSGRGKKAASDMGVRYIGAVPLDPELSDAGDDGKPYVLFRSETEIAESFRRIVNNIIDKQT